MCSPFVHHFSESYRQTAVHPKVCVSDNNLYDLLLCSTLRFSQGLTANGLGFEAFYGVDWVENVEDKFQERSVQVFGGTPKLLRNMSPFLTCPIIEKGSERQNKFLLPDDGSTPPEASSSGSHIEPEASSSQNPSTEVTPPEQLLP